MPNPPGTLRQDFADQRAFVRSRAPAYAHLLGLLEAELDQGLEERLASVWQGRRFGAFYERPLLLLAALRDEALRDGEPHPLWRAIGQRTPDPDSADAAAVKDALAPQRARFWRILAERHVQTNEPSRAVAWLWPARISAGAAGSRPLALFDVGASAGLNLVADRLPAVWEHADGSPLAVEPGTPLDRRVGFDPRPLDALDEEDARWLRACIWPGQTDREARLDAAISAFGSLQGRPDAPTVHRARAGEVPGLLPRGEDGRLALVYQTIVRDYLPPDEWAAYRSGLERWLADRPAGSALWVELEVTEAARSGGPPAAITAHVSTSAGLRALVLAHCEPHPRRLHVHRDAVETLEVALTGR
jgi:hypothetical protein